MIYFADNFWGRLQFSKQFSLNLNLTILLVSTIMSFLDDLLSWQLLATNQQTIFFEFKLGYSTCNYEWMILTMLSVHRIERYSSCSFLEWKPGASSACSGTEKFQSRSSGRHRRDYRWCCRWWPRCCRSRTRPCWSCRGSWWYSAHCRGQKCLPGHPCTRSSLSRKPGTTLFGLWWRISRQSWFFLIVK